jgi:hypothetical protein
MVFTPLLASTTVGTLEARSVALHITSIQKALQQPQNQYVQVRPAVMQCALLIVHTAVTSASKRICFEVKAWIEGGCNG